MTSPAPELVAVAVARAWDETPTLRALVLDAAPLVPRHTTPGQYVKARARDKEGFFALANAPGAPLELLVKRGGAAADALAALEPGATIEITAPMGKGYPIEQHRGHDLLLVAVGSGIAPIRSVVRHVLADRGRFGAVRVYYGQRRPEDFAYAREEEEWRRQGIELVRVPSAEGVYVQDALRASPPPLANCCAYVSGMKPMIAAVTDTLVGLGLERGRVFLNF